MTAGSGPVVVESVAVVVAIVRKKGQVTKFLTLWL
jgi:hypothetical protein